MIRKIIQNLILAQHHYVLAALISHVPIQKHGILYYFFILFAYLLYLAPGHVK